jgi:hypothetical protein
VRLTAYPTTFWGGLENRAPNGAIYLGLTQAKKAENVVYGDCSEVAVDDHFPDPADSFYCDG